MKLRLLGAYEKNTDDLLWSARNIETEYFVESDQILVVRIEVVAACNLTIPIVSLLKVR